MKYLIPILLILSLAACKKEAPCKKPAPAFFTMTQMVPLYGTWQKLEAYFTEVDTASSAGGDLFFEAFGDYDSLLWKVGGDKREWRTKKFALDFGQYIGPVDIRLVAWHTPDRNCYPEDDGVDTIIKRLILIPGDSLPIWGTYKGNLENIPDSAVTIIIDPATYDLTGVLRCDNPEAKEVDVMAGTYNFSFISTWCNEPYGIGYLSKDKEHLKLDYYVWNNVARTGKLHFIFNGKRSK